MYIILAEKNVGRRVGETLDGLIPNCSPYLSVFHRMQSLGMYHQGGGRGASKGKNRHQKQQR